MLSGLYNDDIFANRLMRDVRKRINDAEASGSIEAPNVKTFVLVDVYNLLSRIAIPL